MKEREDIIARIRAGDEEEIVALYQRYQKEFLHWAAYRFSVDRDEALDIFQDTLICFYEDIKQEKLTYITHTVKIYLFAVAKNKIYAKLRYNQKFSNSEMSTNHFYDPESADEGVILTERKKVIMQVIEQMGEPCYAILKLFYFDAFSMEAIAQKLQYKNADVVKSQKVRCINDLRQRVMKHFKKEDL